MAEPVQTNLSPVCHTTHHILKPQKARRWGELHHVSYIYFPLQDGLHGNDFIWPRGFLQIFNSPSSSAITHRCHNFLMQNENSCFILFLRLIHNDYLLYFPPWALYEKLTRRELVYFKAALQFRHLNGFGWLVKILFHFWFIFHVQS